MTHLQFANTPDHEISSPGDFWHKKNTVKVLELLTFQSRNYKKQKCNPDFHLISLFALEKHLEKKIANLSI